MAAGLLRPELKTTGRAGVGTAFAPSANVRARIPDERVATTVLTLGSERRPFAEEILARQGGEDVKRFPTKPRGATALAPGTHQDLRRYDESTSNAPPNRGASAAENAAETPACHKAVGAHQPAHGRAQPHRAVDAVML